MKPQDFFNIFEFQRDALKGLGMELLWTCRFDLCALNLKS